MKYLGIIIEKSNIQRTYNTGDRKVSEINTHFSKISEINLGLQSQSFKNILHGRNTAAPSIRSTGLGRNSRKGIMQENANWSTKANKHKDCKSLQNGVKRGIVYNHRIKTHSHQNKRNGGTLRNSQRRRYMNLQIDHDKLPNNGFTQPMGPLSLTRTTHKETWPS